MLNWHSGNPVARFVGTGEPTTTRMLNVSFCGNVRLSLALYAFAQLQWLGEDHHSGLSLDADISSAAHQKSMIRSFRSLP
jgi:hypothetical protein